MKTCTKCSLTKPVEEFYFRSDRPHLRQSHCQTCVLEKNRKYSKDNRDKISVNKKRYYELHRNDILKSRAHARKEMSEEERQAYCDYLRAWRYDNPDSVRDARRNTRAKRKQAYVEHVSFEAIWNRDNGVCQLCGMELDRRIEFPDWKSSTLDHIVPLAKGGLHEMTNVQLACWQCNWHKRDNI